MEQPWSQDELEFLAQWGPFVSQSEMSAVLGRSERAVRYKLKEIGKKSVGARKMRKPKPQPFTPTEPTTDQKLLERDFYATLVAAWQAGHKDVGRVIDYFHTERRIHHGWQNTTKRF